MPKTLRWKIDRVTSRHVLEWEIEAGWLYLSRGRLAESTAAQKGSYAVPPLLLRS